MDDESWDVLGQVTNSPKLMGEFKKKIVEELEEEESTIEKIYDAAMKFTPDYDAVKIYDELQGKWNFCKIKFCYGKVEVEFRIILKT